METESRPVHNAAPDFSMVTMTTLNERSSTRCKRRSGRSSRTCDPASSRSPSSTRRTSTPCLSGSCGTTLYSARTRSARKSSSVASSPVSCAGAALAWVIKKDRDASTGDAFTGTL
ncbi:uncharacterized protein GLRG_08856 [Colletotrichum graminicola M1.001]|uniref:Uncharacterized protein n=1 Tax=Colletotrichum graminicola (strain M1.001 / M2 / FGSC 10212) TaxID=645133 RepID=E3QS85_COLGM|nr:uncharacterized protein GLRG_08856 [Colletotrichum graminicola M1.001]EFQ33712.1 hypothetical protein GLRG_08856 [Colletotrichum graminicola M1.001]